MVAAAREVDAGAAALGNTLPYRDVPAHLMHVARTTGHNISSMLQDVRRQVPTEIDAICGAVVQRGAHLNIPTPVNAALWRLMQAKEQGQSTTPAEVCRFLSQVA
jgi:2-dehydropantoate 2-reductase